MKYQELINTQEEFYSLSNDLLNASINSFDANLLSFKYFCESNDIVKSIIKPILDINFNGIEYFNNVSSPLCNSEEFAKPKKREEFVKVAIDLLNIDMLSASNMYNYALWFLHPSTDDINQLTHIGTKDIFGKLIKYINLQLTKLINNNSITSTSGAVIYNIENANDSIIGNQTNATINNSNNLDDLIEVINNKVIDQQENEQLKELVSMLKAITENNIPVQKGVFARFSEVLQKNSWLQAPLRPPLLNG